MRFMLDTSMCIDLLRGSSSAVLSRFRRFAIDDIAISAITLAELQYGVAKSSRPVHHALLLAQFCAPFAVVPFDHRAGEIYGQVRSALEREGTPIGALDMLIASHAVALAVTLITSNEREFKRVPGWRMENWRTP